MKNGSRPTRIPPQGSVPNVVDGLSRAPPRSSGLQSPVELYVLPRHTPADRPYGRWPECRRPKRVSLKQNFFLSQGRATPGKPTGPPGTGKPNGSPPGAPVPPVQYGRRAARAARGKTKAKARPEVAFLRMLRGALHYVAAGRSLDANEAVETPVPVMSTGCYGCFADRYSLCNAVRSVI